MGLTEASKHKGTFKTWNSGWTEAKMALIAGIHTLEIETPKSFINASYVGWRNFDRETKCNRTKINPHKLKLDENGKWQTVYGSLKKYKAAMAQIYAEQEIDTATVNYRRVDLCVDSDEPYEQTARLYRLFLLLMAQEYKTDNDYMSVEPLTCAPKSMRIAKRRKNSRNSALEIENYNRANIYQKRYDREVINRLEFRLMGRRMSSINTPEKLIDKWRELIDSAITPEKFKTLEQSMAVKLLKRSLDLQVQPKDMLVIASDWILTKGQIEVMYKNAGLKPDSGRRRAAQHGIELYSYEQVVELKEAIFGALDDFVRN